MPTITLKFKENIIKEVRLGRDDSLTIGRRDTNDIIIENLAVSGTHAKIDSVEDGFLITDLQSKNGTFVNDQLITSHYLNHGDVITIGKHVLIFAYAADEKRPKKAAPAMDQTMVMDTSRQREMLASTASDNIPPGLQQSGPLGMLTFLSGGEGEVVLTKKLTKIGKSPDSDIVIGGLLVGKSAATISHRPAGYFVSYVGGVSKLKVNDQTIKNSVKLEEFDILQIGPAKMQFIHKK
ncbi:MAG: FHA domain-containing protein [Thermodesulfobacteriota bacterium]